MYWNWSPNTGFAVNVPVRGYNETLITYLLAAGSSTNSIPVEVYQQGWAQNGSIKNGNTYYGHVLPLGDPYGGPLFFTQYSFLGFNPHVTDPFLNVDFWTQNVNQSLINHDYCVSNPQKYAGYSDDCWGLTASDNPWGYGAHVPTNDNGTISPTAAISSMPYTSTESMKAIKYFYYILGDRMWGKYGFYDAFNFSKAWTATSYLAIDEGPIVVMIENYRTQLLWNLFMTAPEVQAAKTKLGFN
ncbi:MAG: glucoamylase family protein [Cyclobacteriaceae bacterium]